MKKQTFSLQQITLSLIAFGVTSACAPTGFSANPAADQTAPSKRSNDGLVKQVCVPEAADFLWDINVFGFSLGGFDFNVGYNGPGAGPITSIAVGAEVTKGTLNLQMWTQKPYDVAHSLGADLTQTSGFKFNVDLGIARFGAGSNQDGQSALIKLSQKTFSKLLETAARDLARDPNPWSTHIVKQLDANRFEIPVGALGGLRYGDQFQVYKYEYNYERLDDCASVLGGSKLSNKPIATLIPLDIRDGSSTMTLVGSPTTPIGVNDLIEVKELFRVRKGEKRTLKNSVRIKGLHQPNRIVVRAEGRPDAEIDVTSYLQYQIPTLLNASENYWLSP